MTSNPAFPNLNMIREAARIVRKLARKAEASAVSGSPNQYPRLLLLQADIAWKLSNKDLAILLYQKAGQAFGSMHLIPLKVTYIVCTSKGNGPHESLDALSLRCT